ncbi:MAG: acetoacetate--CoA ligase [Pseudomonadota bacterium]|nr:acetoacetate--CoA ligase [Pseudomonadota bacterium]
MPKELWKPNTKQILESNMMALYQRVFEENNKDPNYFDYSLLHKWSLNNPDKFWDSVWDDSGIIGDKGEIIIDQYEDLLDSQFFPDSKINFAENLLKGNEDSQAIVFYGEGKDKSIITLSELRKKVFSLALWLKGNGIEVGDRVATLLPNCPETIIAMLATSSIGGIFTSCSPDFGEEGIVDRFGQSRPKIFITCDGYIYGGKKFDIREKSKNISERISSINKTINVNYVNLENINKGDNWNNILKENMNKEFRFQRFPFNVPLYILYSSGTTGKPKCIVHSAGGTLIQHIKEHKYHCDMKKNDRVLYFTTCGWMMWNWMVSALASEATLILYDGSPIFPNPSILFEVAEEEDITFFGASAKYIDSLNKLGVKPNDKYSFSNMRVFASTGSPLSPNSYDWVYSNIKDDIQLSSISGGTDIVACFVHGNPCLPVNRGEIQCASLGMDIQSWDDDALQLFGKAGELVCVNSFPSIPIGFWEDKDKKKFKESYFEKYENVWHHGDFIIATEHNSFIVEGRSDATLNPGGIRIGTAEIYRQVEALPEVLEALAVGQNWKNDQRILLFLIMKDNRDLDRKLIDKIKNTIRKGASPRHVPAKVFKVKDFPRTRSGKISELAVRDIIHKKKLKNIEALANPEILEIYNNLDQLDK